MMLETLIGKVSSRAGKFTTKASECASIYSINKHPLFAKVSIGNLFTFD